MSVAERSSTGAEARSASRRCCWIDSRSVSTYSRRARSAATIQPTMTTMFTQLTWRALTPPQVAQHQHGHAREAVAQAPDHGVDERLHRELDARRHRKIQQLDAWTCRSSSAGPGRWPGARWRPRGCPRSGRRRSRHEQRQGHHEQRGADAEMAQESRGHEQLEQEAGDAGEEVEVAEEPADGVLVHRELGLGEGLELPVGGGGGDGREADDRGDGAQVGGRTHELQALQQACRRSCPQSQPSGRVSASASAAAPRAGAAGGRPGPPGRCRETAGSPSPGARSRYRTVRRAAASGSPRR